METKFWIYGWIEQSFVLRLASLLKIGWRIHIEMDGHIDDWDITFHKIVRTFQLIGINIFHWGKCMTPFHLQFCLYRKISDQKPRRYLFLAYVDKSRALVNELIFSCVYQYISFSDEFVDPTLIFLSILLKTLTFWTRDMLLAL